MAEQNQNAADQGQQQTKNQPQNGAQQNQVALKGYFKQQGTSVDKVLRLWDFLRYAFLAVLLKITYNADRKASVPDPI